MTPSEPTRPAAQQTSTAAKKTNKRKKSGTELKLPTDNSKTADATQDGDPPEENSQSGEETATPTTSVRPTEPLLEETGSNSAHQTAQNAPKDPSNGHEAAPVINGHLSGPSPSGPPPADGTGFPAEGPETAEPSVRLEAMLQEREALRAEVEKMRKQLESIRETHTTETTKLRSELEESETAREQAEEQYQTLRERVEKIKETLGNRLARDKEELEETKERVEELESQNEALQNATTKCQEELAGVKTELQDATRELSSLRSRSNLSQHNMLKEKEDMTRQIQHLRQEAEAAKDAMGDWEVLAMEERSVRESLSEKTAALEEQVATLRDSYERAASERDSQAQAVDSLQRALQEIQEARKIELREMVESSEAQLQAMKRLVKEADTRAVEAEAVKESLQKELERTAPFEKEVKEKNLLIGKLRHEAIVLNDHLTKALRYLKKTKPEDSIDRQIVTNHFLQFLALDRSDPKKFQILQIIAGFLNWTDEQREQAGLARPGTASSSLRLPMSPFHRTPSTPSLNTDFFTDPTPSSAHSKESLADLWAGFLERSVEEADGQLSNQSRKASMSSVATTTTNAARRDPRERHGSTTTNS